MTTIKLDHITKIEGHASLNLHMEDDKVTKCELQVVEGSRYFEGLLRDRAFSEAPEVSSRICGICSCAHTVCSIQAMENALRVRPSEQTVRLRELMTIGERIRSHTTHLYFLAFPDYMGYDSALDMASKHRDQIQKALDITHAGNDIIRSVAGRDLHPVSATIGGFLKLPGKEELGRLSRELKGVRKHAIDTVKTFSRLRYPDFTRETEHFSLVKKGEYPILYGDLKSESGIYKQKDYRKYLSEYHEKYSTANFVVKEGRDYMVGALSRLMNNHIHLSPGAFRLLDKSRIELTDNPFLNNFAQAVELVHCIDAAIGICENLDVRDEDPVEPRARKASGLAAIEVPRGILWHDYDLDKNGRILHANIITPTCQNLRNAQDDIREYVQSQLVGLPKEKLVFEIEKLIRAYDPCFSCSTHFLDLKLKRTK
jgi:sulfhydrogenase subunit alpha